VGIDALKFYKSSDQTLRTSGRRGCSVDLNGWTLFETLEKHFHGDFGAEAAGIGFTRGQGAVFPKLVASIPASAQPKVFEALLARFHSLGHVFKQELK
jgi:hypothetical protein